MNHILISGNLTRDPESRTTQSGTVMCHFTVAVTSRQKDANGDRKTEFFRVAAFGQRAEFCMKYFTKGCKVIVQGPVALNTYTGRDGAQHASLEVTADEVEAASLRGSSAPMQNAPAQASVQAQQQPPQAPQTPPQAPLAADGYTVVDSEELPF